ncbi:Uncharacterized protein y4hQ [Grifola frondosa]|uniref:Uncharacterized protein y4hQ n=1 Tax=Grifola frondosa TaxID=5627 RepID=A0A1C7MTN0_GRIFR|nr:Uncharacterized protein y4hQ [Grifola frondosa]
MVPPSPLICFRDGSLFGPEGSGSIDRMHIAQVGYDYLPDDNYNLAHTFSKEGDKFGYLYDFGDKWFHDIEVEHICSPEESNGEVVIIDGEGMCPGENMDGSWKYVENTKILNDGTPSEKLAKKREILQSPNYNDYKKSASQFNHKSFDLPLAISRLSAALGSSASVSSGAKVYHMPIMSGAEEIARGMHVKRGQKVEQKWDEENGGFWQETTSSTRDRRAEAVCAACGNSAGMQLKACSGCKQVLYCSRQHQYEHWKNGHKQQCSRKFSDKEKSAGSK